MLLKPFTYFLILGISTVIVAPLITKASSLEDRVALEDQGVRIIANTVDVAIFSLCSLWRQLLAVSGIKWRQEPKA